MKRFNSIKALVLVVVLAAAGTLGVHNVFAASTGQIYITPASASVQNGSKISVAVRINPGTAVNSVQFTLNFNPSLLKYSSFDASSTAFPTNLPPTITGTSVSFLGVIPAGTTSSDSLIATVVFQGIADSGTAALTLTNANASADGTSYTNPAVVGGSISLSAVPAPPPPSPPSGGSSSGSSGSTSSSSGSTTTTTKSTASGSTTSTSGGGTTTPPQIVAENGSDSGTVTPQFTAATISLKTSVPTQAYIKYGTDTKLSVVTPLSALETTHSIALDPAMLIPGTTYYYQVVVKDAAGNQTATQVKSFTTKGYTLHVAVLDKNGHPLANVPVELHSATKNATTNDKGVAIFTDVAPGTHHVVYTSGKMQLTQPVTVNNTVTTDKSSGAQSATVQNLSVQFATTKSSINVLLPIVMIGLLAVVALAFFLRGRFTPIPAHQGYAAATVGQPASISAPAPNDPTQQAGASIEHAHGIQAPDPGSVIAPADHSDEVK